MVKPPILTDALGDPAAADDYIGVSELAVSALGWT